MPAAWTRSGADVPPPPGCEPAGARIAGVTPLILLVPGALALLAGVAILRSFGPGFRIGRLLASTPVLPLPEVLRLADGPERYVGVRGRIDAEEPFEDDAHRPLVLQRVRLALRETQGWRTVDEQRRAVPFEIREGLDGLAIDGDALDAGLVVMPRESIGRADDVPERLPAGTPPDRAARLRVEYVSAVDHAIAIGVPRRATDGSVRLGPGRGRPLILSTLEPDEAMRILAGGDGRRSLAAAIALGGGLALVTLGVAWAILGAMTGIVSAASPEPSVAPGGDPRSAGQGPGLVGDPLMAIVLVVAIGLAAAVATYAWVRLRPPATRP